MQKSDIDDIVGIGASIPRKEDFRFVTGNGRFLDNLAIPNLLSCYIVRSRLAHARLRTIIKEQAIAAPGVIAVFTGEDMAADKIGPMTCLWKITSKDGTAMIEPPRWALARHTVRHIGEPVAVVVANHLDQAMDAAELIEIDYEELPAIVQSNHALTDDAPQLHEGIPENKCFHWARGNEEAVKNAFAQASHITQVDLINNRLVGAAIETRGVVGSYDQVSGLLTLHSTTQTPHHTRQAVATELSLPEGKLRVISPDVGGGFGYKGKHYPEETIIAWIALKLQQPVKWIANRSESFISDTQGRDHLTNAQLALDEEGQFLGLRVETIANLGAYVSTFGAAIPSAIYSALLAGVYRTPAIYVEVIGVFTNTVPTDAYRGAGRPEACFVLERLADLAARELSLDRAEIRKRNLVQHRDMPYATPIGPTYDCGNFPKILQRVLEVSDYESFSNRKDKSLQRGLLRGVGIACFVESSGVAPSRLAGMLGAVTGFYESAHLRVDSQGAIQALFGTHSHGQGHETTFAQIISDSLRVPLSKIEIIEGDTDVVPIGSGTFGSRSMAVGGSALDGAIKKIIDKGKRIAAHLIEASVADIEFKEKGFFVIGTNRGVSFKEVAHAAYVPHNYPLEELEPGLEETAFYDPSNFAFSNGAHVCEVEIDPETGLVNIANYWTVDDVGTVINPMIVEGQVHGGIAQGIGQALMESCIYDTQSGQLLSGSFMDYAVPHASDLPLFVSELDESEPCTHNPLGVKGCGESGAIGAPPAVINAILDALAPLGVKDIEMPATANRIWHTIMEVRQ